MSCILQKSADADPQSKEASKHVPSPEATASFLCPLITRRFSYDSLSVAALYARQVGRQSDRVYKSNPANAKYRLEEKRSWATSEVSQLALCKPSTLTTSEMDPNKPYPNLERTESLVILFDRFGTLERSGLDEAIKDCLSALDIDIAMSSSESQQVQDWNNLYGLALALRYDEYGQDDDYTEARRVLELSEAQASAGSAQHERALYGLGRLWKAREIRTNSKDDLDLSIYFYRKLMTMIAKKWPDAVSDVQDVRLQLSLALTRRFSHITPQDCDFVEPYDHVQSVSECLEKGHTLNAFAHFCRATVLFQRWSSGGRHASDLLGSEDGFRNAIHSSPDHRLRHLFVKGLGRTLHFMHTRCSASIDYLHEAISCLEEASTIRALFGPQDIWLQAVRENLGSAYISRFHSAGELQDLTRAVEVFRHIQPPSLNNISAALSYRYQETGKRDDLDECILAARGALEIATSKGAVGRTYEYFNLGHALSLRFRLEMQPEDFEQARMYLSAALDSGARDAYMPCFCHRVLAKLLYAKYEAAHEVICIDLAVAHLRSALAMLPVEYQDTPSYLSELAECLSVPRSSRQAKDSLAEGMENHERALLLAPAGYGERHLLMWRYAHALRLRFENSGDMGDIDKSVIVLKDLTSLMQARHPRRSLYLSELALCCALRYGVLKEICDLTLALDLYTASAELQEGYTKDRLDAAVSGARLAHGNGQFVRGTTLYSIAVSLLPRLAWLGYLTEVRHAQLVSVTSSFVSDAAACALTSGFTERSVELLEEGRSVLWQSILAVRASLRDLEEITPELANELREVGQALEHGSARWSGLSETHPEQLAHRRRKLAERWEALVDHVRRLDGLHSFLKPPSFSDLRQAAKDGPIIILNISSFRSDALVISATDRLRTVALRGLSMNTVARLAYVLTRGLQVARDADGLKYIEGVLQYILRCLWHGGLADVAIALFDWRRTEARHYLPRVWWVPTGLISLLPIHCAGPYEGSGLGIFDLFVSSYTTTLSALLNARSQGHPASSQIPVNMLAVSVPVTLGFKPLASADREIAVLRGTPFGQSIVLLDGEKATVKTVTSIIAEFNWLHICCHGTSSYEKPLESSFQLYDGPLSLSKIIEMRLTKSQFAFLSACHSARYSPVLPDESLNIATAMQVAGCASIVASAWSMADEDGPVLAKHFYDGVTTTGQTPDVKQAAESLHRATMSMRKAGTSLHRWATFIHIGI